MIHQRQRLPLRFETRDQLARVHAGLDDLECDLAAHRLPLLSHPYDAESALPDFLEELVRTDQRVRHLVRFEGELERASEIRVFRRHAHYHFAPGARKRSTSRE